MSGLTPAGQTAVNLALAVVRVAATGVGESVDFAMDGLNGRFDLEADTKVDEANDCYPVIVHLREKEAA